MDYRKAYLHIVYRAKMREIPEGYYEEHHILPKSLGGLDHSDNLTSLTAREHFICHWLLVKMFKKGTAERRKMLYAFWRMKSSPKIDNPRYINARAYEKLRREFSEMVSEQNKIMQKGERNSQYGKKWYTNYETGECHPFFDKPSDKWILGRNLFRGESDKIRFSINDKLLSIKQIEKIEKTRKEAQYYWDLYHKSNCSSFLDFCNKGLYKYSRISLILRFKRYIPYYSKFTSQGNNKNSASNPYLVGVYE